MAANVKLNTLAYFSPAMGVALTATEDAAVTGAAYSTQLHNDKLSDAGGAAGLKALCVGGGSDGASQAGRWYAYWQLSPTGSGGTNIGTRCSIEFP